MPQTEIKLPKLTEGDGSVSISFWHYEEGDAVKENDDLLEVMSEKATFSVPSPVTGRLIKRCYGEGAGVNAGDIIALIEEQ